jgi:hypothetical protein
VHRGPDLKPRLFIASLLIMALTEAGELALPPASKRSGAAKRKRAIARHAATLNTVALVQRVMREAAEGDDAVTGHAIRLLALAHDTLQPTKHEAAKGGQGPILPKFNRPAPSAPPSPPTSIAPEFEQRATVIGPDGTEYMEPEL